MRSGRARFPSGVAVAFALAGAACGSGPDAADVPPPPTTPAADEASSEGDHLSFLRGAYEKTEHMVPMRDGTELYTIVYAPTDDSREYPILLFRTPYSIGPYDLSEYRNPLGPSEEFDRAGYIFAFQDVRGQFKSEGDFEVIRPLAREPRAPTDTDESTDNYDAIEESARTPASRT